MMGAISMGALGSHGALGSVAALGGWTPANLPDLKFWVDVSTIEGLSDADPVATWSDLSGNGHDLTQGTAGNRPSYHVAIQNGLAVVRFGADDSMSESSSIDLKTACSLFMVLQLDSATNQAGIIGKEANDLVLVSWDGAQDGFGLAESGVAFITTENSINNTNWQVVTLTWDGSLGASSVAIIYRNGVSIATDTYDVGNLANNANLVLGVDGAVYLNADVGEVVIYQSVLSTVHRQQVESYLASKWGI